MKPLKLIRSFQDRLERRINTDTENASITKTSTFWASNVSWGLIFTAVFGISWLAIAKTEEVVVAPGKLEPTGAVKEIRLQVGGVVSRILVKEGQRVKAGQPLLQLDTEATQDRRVSLEGRSAFKETQLKLKELERQRYLDLNDTEQKSLKRNLALETDVMKRLEQLNRQGGVGELQYLAQLNKVEEIKGKLNETRVDRLRQASILDQSIQALRSEANEIKSSITEVKVNIRYQTVKSPVDGIVFELKPTNPGFSAQTNEPVVKIVPLDRLVARVQVNSNQIGFVSIGKPADISIDSFPATDFGVLSGTVLTISSDAIPPDQLKPEYRFPVDIKLNNQQLKLQGGQLLPLQVGMSLQANIKLRKVSYLQLLFKTFRDKADSLRTV